MSETIRWVITTVIAFIAGTGFGIELILIGDLWRLRKEIESRQAKARELETLFQKLAS